MFHPRLTPLGSVIGGPDSRFLATIGPTGAWSDLTMTPRWGTGACGILEATWQMPLPANFDDSLLRRGTLVELMDGPVRVGAPLVMGAPGKGSGYDQPWTVTCTGIAREVEGDSSYIAFDVSGNATAVPNLGVDRAKLAGWKIDGYDSTVPVVAIGAVANTDGLQTVGQLLNAAGQQLGKRWLVNDQNILTFANDPTAPIYETTPGVAQLGTADDDYYSVIWVNYIDSTSTTYQRVYALNGQTDAKFGRREQAVDLEKLGPIPAATAQSFANGILAELGGKLSWLGDITVSSNELLCGGVPADLSLVMESVSKGCMVRLHGQWDDLIEFTGNTWIDVVIGEAPYKDGDDVITLKPLGAAPRDLAAVIERVTGLAAGS